jgi:hypothetical protein
MSRPRLGWDEVLSTLVGFVGREVVVQVLGGTPSAAPPILTATGTLADGDPRFEGALATDTVLVRLTRVDEARSDRVLVDHVKDSIRLLIACVDN